MKTENTTESAKNGRRKTTAGKKTAKAEREGNITTTEAAKKTVVRAKAGLNLRLAPNLSAEVIRILRKGETIETLGESSGWLACKEGWIMAEFTEVISDD